MTRPGRHSRWPYPAGRTVTTTIVIVAVYVPLALAATAPVWLAWQMPEKLAAVPPAAWFPIAVAVMTLCLLGYEMRPGNARRDRRMTSDERWSYTIPAETDPYVKQPGDLTPREALDALSPQTTSGPGAAGKSPGPLVSTPRRPS